MAGTRAPGLYRFSSRAQANTILNDLAQAGWQGFYLNGQAVYDKASFLHAAAAAMHFPAYFGHNWDAFEECIRDFAWVPTARGYVLLYDEVANFAGRDAQSWQTARAILAEAVAEWQARGVPLYVLLRRTWRFTPDLPWLDDIE